MSNWRDGAEVVQNNGRSWRDDAEVVETPDVVTDSRNPDISWANRAIAKNFAQSPEAMQRFIQQEYPGLDVKVVNGEVVARRPGEANFTRLDPSGFDLEDITDLGDVVSSGVASQLGLWGGAAAGALASGPAAPAGAIAGGIAGSAGASAAHEGLRQAIGAKLGIPQEVSGSDVAMAGALGGAGVGLLGSGPLKGLASSGETQGLIRAGWNKGMPKLTASMGGLTDEALSLYVNPASRAKVDELASGGRTEFTDDLVSRVTSALNKEKQDIGSRLASSIDGAAENVDIGAAKQQFVDNIGRLRQIADDLPTPENVAALSAAEKQYNALFKDVSAKAGAMNPLTLVHEGDGMIPNALRPSQAWRLQQQLKDAGDLKTIAGGVNPRYASQATLDEKAGADRALGAYRSIGNELDRVTDGIAPELKQQYAGLMDVQDALRPLNGSTQSAYSAFNNMDGSGKMAFREALEKLGTRTGDNFAGDVNKLQAAEHFGSGSWLPKSMKGTTSTTKTLTGGGAGAGLGFLLGGYPGMVVGGMAGSVASSPQAIKYGIKATDPLRRGADAMGRVYAPMTPVIRETVVKSPWDFE